jgi:UDP-2,3-diacylglucosamine pyrophosphatase LpxH
MLAIISDLHFCDGTATNKNVRPEAFEIALRDLYDQAGSLADKNGSANLDLVMLGDVFDLLRTTRWFEDKDGTEVTVGGRPWGTPAALDGAAPPPPVLDRAHRILDEIIDKNQGALDTLGGKRDGALHLDKRVTVRRILLPGNHDRLALHDDKLYARMRAAIGAVDEQKLGAEGIFPHRIQMPAYGLLARHGHEWDSLNFESFLPGATAADYDDGKYLPAPIGDPITTEIAARVPYEMHRRLANIAALTDEDRKEIDRRLVRVEDVRPLLASIQWVYQEVAHIHQTLGDDKARAVRAALDDSVRAIVDDFRRLDFYKEWVDRHHRWFHFDDAEKIKAVLDALSVVSVDTVDRLAPVFEKILDRAASPDDDRTGAAREHAELVRMGTQGMHFVVYGHTHEAEQAPLTASPDIESLYLNTGTFRQRVFLTDDRKGFSASDYMSYVSFSREDEAATWRNAKKNIRGPGYSAWTGLRSR